jgi:hypothetical protein
MCIMFNHFNKQSLLRFHENYIILIYTILTKPCNILHYCYPNEYTLIVSYFITVSFIVALVSAPCRWLDNNVLIRRSHVKDSRNKI